jgi:hypothetical protein
MTPGRIFRPHLLLFILSLNFIRCGQSDKPLTGEEVKTFARQLETSVNKREAAFFDNAIDRNTLLKRANIPASKNSGGFKRGLANGMTVGTALKQSLSAKATYTLIKQYQKDNVPHLLFRLYDNGSLNYHDLELIRSDGEPRIADMFVYTTGENLSETLHKIYLQFADEMKKSSLSSETDEWLTQMPEIRKLMGEDKYREASDLFNKIPEKVRKGRSFQILHVELSSGLPSDEYSAAIDEYRQLFPNEPNMHLLLLDGYILHKEYDKALNAVNELDKQINTDPLLDFYRFLCYKLMDKAEEGKQYLVRLVKNMPDFEDGLLELISVDLDEKDFESAKPLVEKYKNKKSYDQSTLELVLLQHPDFKDSTR